MCVPQGHRALAQCQRKTLAPSLSAVLCISLGLGPLERINSKNSNILLLSKKKKERKTVEEREIEGMEGGRERRKEGYPKHVIYSSFKIECSMVPWVLIGSSHFSFFSQWSCI